MTVYAYRHLDSLEEIAQFFVSELHPELFSVTFQAAVLRIVVTVVDPLSANDVTLLAKLADNGVLSLEDATTLARAGVRCFGRHHAESAHAASLMQTASGSNVS